MRGHPRAHFGPVLSGLRAITRRVMRVAFHARVFGLEHVPLSGPVLLAGNHTGLLDGPFVYAVLPRPAAFLVKSELYAIRPLAWALDRIGQIPVHRGQPDRTALRLALGVLAEGGAVGLFPEGTRGKGTFESVQHGIAYLAVKSNAPIVPVACLGSGEALPEGHAIPRLGVRVDIVFGPPLHLQITGDPRARSTVAAAATELHGRLLEHLHYAREVTGRAAALR